MAASTGRKATLPVNQDTTKSPNRLLCPLPFTTNTLMGLNGKESIPFTVKGPIPVHLPEPPGERAGQTRCAIMDLTFQYPCQIGELIFTNYYTAWLSIYIKRSNKSNKSPDKDSQKSRHLLERSFSIDIHGDHFLSPCESEEAQVDSYPLTTSTAPKQEPKSTPKAENPLEVSRLPPALPFPRRHSSGSLSLEKQNPDPKPWELSLEMKNLMPWPHYENGSQDLISIPATESIAEWRDVVSMRLVLHQPSSVWKKFTIEEIDVFRHLPKRGYSHCTQLLKQRNNWFSMLRINTKTMLSGQLVEPENPDDSIQP